MAEALLALNHATLDEVVSLWLIKLSVYVKKDYFLFDEKKQKQKLDNVVKTSFELKEVILT